MKDRLREPIFQENEDTPIGLICKHTYTHTHSNNNKSPGNIPCVLFSLSCCEEITGQHMKVKGSYLWYW